MATLADLPMIQSAPAIAPEELSPMTTRMHLMLAAIKPRSDAEALRLLRTSFPQSTLNERLSALSRLRR
jgi:hypothetical protein